MLASAVALTFAAIPAPAEAGTAWTISVDASAPAGALAFRPEADRETFKMREPTVTNEWEQSRGGVLHAYLAAVSSQQAPDPNQLVQRINLQIEYYKSVDVTISGWPASCAAGDYPCYQSWLTSVLTTLKDGVPQIHYYEVENEGDLHLTQAQLEAEYTRAAAAVASVNASIENGPSILIGPDFFHGGGPYAASVVQYFHANDLPMDIYTFHTYGQTAKENFANQVKRIEASLAANGYSNAQLLVTEYGYTPCQCNLPSNTQAATYATQYAALASFWPQTEIVAAMHFTQINQQNYNNSEFRTQPVPSAPPGGFETYPLASPVRARYILVNPDGMNINGVGPDGSPVYQTVINEIQAFGPTGQLPATSPDYPQVTDSSTSTSETIPRKQFNTILLDFGSVQTVTSLRVYWPAGQEVNRFAAFASVNERDYAPILGGITPNPIANVMDLLSMLHPQMLQVEGNSNDPNAYGPIALATANPNDVAILVSNYQNGGSSAYDLNLIVRNLPPAFSSGPVQYNVYRVDATHGNTLYAPSQTTPALIQGATTGPGTQSLTLDLPPDSSTMITLHTEPGT